MMQYSLFTKFASGSEANVRPHCAGGQSDSQRFFLYVRSIVSIAKIEEVEKYCPITIFPTLCKVLEKSPGKQFTKLGKSSIAYR